MSDDNSPAFSLDSLDLTALIASRVCHDVISPVGAIVNGLEVLEDEKDEDMREIAFDLIKKSARNASASLQFCRLAFGAAGSAGASIDTRDAQNVALSYFASDERMNIDWQIPPAFLPKNRVKLLLNLIVIAASGITRGGKISVEATGAGDETGFILSATGPNIRVPPHAIDLMAGKPLAETGTVDARAVQPFYAGLLARAAKVTVSVALEGDVLKIIAANLETGVA